MRHYADVFDYITSQEEAYKKPIKLGNKTWSMKDHIERSALYRDSDIVGEKGRFTPIKNITRPILNLQYRTEDIDVKDVDLYVNDKSKYHLSFLVKKYHDDVFVQENDLDTFFDEYSRARIDYGGALSKAIAGGMRENVEWESVVFCDQRDILTRPIGLKHSYSPDELLGMASVGWGEKRNGATASLKEVIVLSRENEKDEISDGDIQVYELHGFVPKRFAESSNDSEEYESRLFIVCFYKKKGSQDKSGIVLYTAPETETPFKLIKRDPIFGRALGFGGAEELFDDQMWTNYAEIRKLHMLDSASKTILGATGPQSSSIVAKNKINDMDNLEIVDLGDSLLQPINTFPVNFKLFENYSLEKEIHAKNMGAAQDPLQGVESASGTPFAAIQAQIQQGMGLHDYRRGQFAKHLEEIYKDDFIPEIVRKITQGADFLSELSLDEIQFVTERMVSNEVDKAEVEYVLSNGGVAMLPEDVDALKQKLTDEFKKKGTKHFIEILKGEFKGATLGVKVSIAGKSKNLGKATDTVVNILRFAFSNPQGFSQVMQIPGMASTFNQVIEFAGLSPVDFSGMEKILKDQMMQQAQMQAQTQMQAQPQMPQLPQPAYG